MLGTRCTDPGVRLSRTRLLPRVITRRPREGPGVHGRACVTGVPRRCVRALGCSAVFPLASPPSLQPLCQPWRPRAVVRERLQDSGAVRLPTSVHHGRAPHGFTMRTLAPSQGQTWVLPIPGPRASVHAWGLRPRQVWPALAVSVEPVLPSVREDHVGTWKFRSYFEAQDPACTSPCQRLADVLPTPAHDWEPR